MMDYIGGYVYSAFRPFRPDVGQYMRDDWTPLRKIKMFTVFCIGDWCTEYTPMWGRMKCRVLCYRGVATVAVTAV